MSLHIIDKNKIQKYVPTCIWEFIRLKFILQSHRKVSKQMKDLLKLYNSSKDVVIRAKQNPDSPIIWQYWGQGFVGDALPDLIKLCFLSVDKYKGNFKVVRLSDDNLDEWIELPSFIVSKYKKGEISQAHYSDIIRLALLHSYGGLWLDATIFLSGPLPQYVTSAEWFMYQRDPYQEDKRLWRRTYAYYFGWHKNFKVRLLNSVIYSRQGSKVMGDLLQLLILYWQSASCAEDYFFFQILFEEYISQCPENNCMIMSDCIPHYLQMFLTGSYIKYDLCEILEKTTLHKMSHKSISAKQLQRIFN